ncbi:hypothetical protein H634G_09606 [Metarhizium anisopliae BRIP 53293]|uniref:Uncharacterized protein n=1 Tax=Metarhizium anisopliae BRIP 53293 TaxID=1291518 RepID=A0A0D9NMU3_METAN|nr:hypothetical protein H634G_09606 [Metarhizium anisopliae BRIP 53293]KJK85587.1 hypothetical protein H633G_10580 [Metarhizium anisopliae BRIP 53284]
MSDPSAPSVILTGITNWLEWQDYIGRKLELATWAAIKTNDKAFIIVEPNRPQISAFNSTDSSAAELPEHQVDSYSLAWMIYLEGLDLHVKQQKQLMRAHDIIYSSVDSRLARYLHCDHDIFQWMKALTDVVLAEQSEQGYVKHCHRQKQVGLTTGCFLIRSSLTAYLLTINAYQESLRKP